READRPARQLHPPRRRHRRVAASGRQGHGRTPAAARRGDARHRSPAEYARREDVPADRVAKEKEIAVAQIAGDPKNDNKPPQILEKIAEGKLKTWFGENVLADQPFVKDDTKTVGDLLKAAGLKVVRFVRYKVGELS